jgi:hypothetical protein
MPSVMIDIETMGTKADCTVLTIGAVQFDPNVPGHMPSTLYLHLDIEEQHALNRSVDADTMTWWATQDAVVRADAFKLYGRVKIVDALAALGAFVLNADTVWSQGPTFDMIILENLYTQMKMPVPWRYSRVRDSRTLFAVLGDQRPVDRSSAHNALSDCIYQAQGVQNCIASITK